MDVSMCFLEKLALGAPPSVILLPTHDGGDFSAPADSAEMTECNYVARASKKSITCAAAAAAAG